MKNTTGHYVLLFIAVFAIIILYIWINPKQPKEAIYSAGDYYETAVQDSEAIDLAEMYNSYTEGYKSACPVVTPLKEEHLSDYSGVFTTGKQSLCGFTYMPAQDAIKMVDAKKLDAYDASEGISISAIAKSKDYAGSSAKIKYYTIIAPFTFSFVNSNTDEDTSIVIESKHGNVKMEVTNILNWYCAGSPGTNTYEGSLSYDWEEHQKHHQTHIGGSSKQVNSGSAGVVLGYAGEDSKIIFSIFDGIQYSPVTIQDLLQLYAE